MGIFAAGGIGIDLGSSFTSVFLENRGLMLREPSRVLVNRENAKQILGVGIQAQAMLGRTVEDVMLASPIMDGAVADVELCTLLMTSLAEKAADKRKVLEKARLVVNVSQGATKVERQALFQAMQAAGAKKPAALRSPMAAALGIGLDVDKPRGVMVVDIGGGTTEIAVLSMNGIVAARAMRLGGMNMDEAIVRYFRREKNMAVGFRTAEELKRDIGTALPDLDEGEKVLLKGRNMETGKPDTIEVTSQDVRKALEEPLCALVDAMRSALENTPPELVSDVMEDGVYLSGGGAMLHGLDELIRQKTGVSVNLSEQAQDAVALGVGRAATDERLLDKLLDAASAEE